MLGHFIQIVEKKSYQDIQRMQGMLEKQYVKNITTLTANIIVTYDKICFSLVIHKCVTNH